MTKTGMDRFEDLVRTALAFDEDYSLNQLPAYGEVLDFARAHPEHRPTIGERLLKTIEGTGDDHLFCYCMGALKWPEVEEQLGLWIERMEAEGNVRSMFFLGSTMQCFRTDYDWP